MVTTKGEQRFFSPEIPTGKVICSTPALLFSNSLPFVLQGGAVPSHVPEKEVGCHKTCIHTGTFFVIGKPLYSTVEQATLSSCIAVLEKFLGNPAASSPTYH